MPLVNGLSQMVQRKRAATGSGVAVELAGRSIGNTELSILNSRFKRLCSM